MISQYAYVRYRIQHGFLCCCEAIFVVLAVPFMIKQGTYNADR
jgi:hypothetical protein